MAKVYIRGSAQEKQFANGGSVINFSVSLDQLKELTTFTTKNGDTRVNLSITKRREADQYGNTHSVYYDDYFDKVKGGGSSPAVSDAASAPVTSEAETDDLPF